MKHLAAAAFAVLAGPVTAAPLCDELGFAGLLASCNRGEPIQLVLSSGKPLFEGDQPVELQSGAYYELEITADGTAELAVSGPSFAAPKETVARINDLLAGMSCQLGRSDIEVEAPAATSSTT